VFRRIAIVLTLLASAAALHPAAPGAPADPTGSPPPGLTGLLERFDATQRATRTLTATFTERKSLRLLAKPVLSQGNFFFSKPGRIKWEYTEPEPRVFLITEDHYLAYYPARKKAEEVPLSKFAGRRVFRVFGIGQTAEDLSKFFEISLADPGPEPRAHLLILTPRRQRVKDRLEVVRFWVDAESFLPRRLEYVESDGDSTTLTFHDIRINPEIADARFTVNLPQDVQITNTFSGFSGGGVKP
jgi:outer membrane lipoprotein carrier protein